jgi:signal peptidase II
MLLNVQKRNMKPRLVALLLSAGIILLDQAAKLIVVLTVPRGHAIPVIGDFFRIINVQNPAIAFSIGRSLAAGTQRTLFGFLPLLVIVLLFLYYLFTREKLTGLQRWTFAALLGGGLGNYVDRIFRHGEVVDFIDVKFYGILGMQRWPTFNLADSTLVVAGILLLTSFLFTREKTAE